MNNFANSYIKYVNHLEEINEAALENPAKMIRQVEQAYQRYLRSIVLDIRENLGRNKIIMLCGPSSSGKTTTANLLRDYLQQDGVYCAMISLDNFYRGEALAPLLPNGHHDYESVDALNVPVLEQCLLDLMTKNCCDMPIFDFAVRSPSGEKRHVELKENGVAIVEGIHALNPRIRTHLPQDRLFKLYISVKQGIKDKDGMVLDSYDLRLLRRMVRDYNFRGTSPERTLDMWPNVRSGEMKYIRPYRNSSDATINSIHIYEAGVIRQTAIPLLQSVDLRRPDGVYVRSLIERLEQFVPIDPALVPSNSVVREFIGGGVYE